MEGADESTELRRHTLLSFTVGSNFTDAITLSHTQAIGHKELKLFD